MVIVGIDEVGRGCWAGPLVAGAVILMSDIPGLKDSKLLTKKQRRNLALEIELQTSFGLGWVEPNEIDALGLTKSTSLAMQRALDMIGDQYDQIIIDGNINFLKSNPKARALIKADMLIPCVSAASILAKHARDTYMIGRSKVYPEYGFDKHVGYGTAYHISKLKEFGVCKLHRLSYKPIKALGESYQP